MPLQVLFDAFVIALPTGTGQYPPACLRSLFDAIPDGKPLTLFLELLLKFQIPGLADEILAEGMVTLFLDQLEARRLVDAAGGAKYVVGP